VTCAVGWTSNGVASGIAERPATTFGLSTLITVLAPRFFGCTVLAIPLSLLTRDAGMGGAWLADAFGYQRSSAGLVQFRNGAGDRGVRGVVSCFHVVSGVRCADSVAGGAGPCAN